MATYPSLDHALATSSAITLLFLTLKAKGLDDNQISRILDVRIEDLAQKINQEANKLLEPLIEEIIGKEEEALNSIDAPWMMDLANRAVEANLNEDGSNKYNSAHGYACAVAAIKLTIDSLEEDAVPADKKLKTTSETAVHRTERDISKLVLIDNAVRYYKVIAEKYGVTEAAQRTVEWVGEQHGVAEVQALGLSTIELKNIYTAISHAVGTRVEG